MGTVHGVYIKYVGLSALSYYGYSVFTPEEVEAPVLRGGEGEQAEEQSANTPGQLQRQIEWLIALMFAYSTIINGIIAILFKLERGMGILGKNRTTGQIPQWSYIVFFPFHIPTIVYTHVHTRIGTMGPKQSTTGNENDSAASTTKDSNAEEERPERELTKPSNIFEKHVPVATEVQPGWWVGGCYGHELQPSDKEWGGIIDLTVEFPETCKTKHYLSIPTWDGVPPSPLELDEAATFSVTSKQQGDVLVHCAHGRGRSTTVMCACLVKFGLFKTWEEAFEKGVKPYRPVCKLNKRMRENLTLWQATYMEGKKGQ